MKDETFQEGIERLELSRKMFEESLKQYMKSDEFKIALEKKRREEIKGPKKRLDL